MDWLLRLFFWDDITGGDVTVHWPPHLPNAESPLQKLLFLALVAGAVGVAWFFYRREPNYLAPRRRRVLAGLRTGALLVLVFILTGAFIAISRSEDTKGSLVLLFDASQSMGIADRRTDKADLAAAAHILDISEMDGETINATTRSMLVRKAMANPETTLLRGVAEKYQIEAYTFGQTAQLAPFELAGKEVEGGPLAALGDPSEPATQLGAALRDTARRLKGRKVDGVVVFSDGGWNRGEDPVTAAQELGVPIYAVGVGLPQTRDIEIPFISADDVVFKGDSFPLHVRLKQRGYAGQSVRLVIKRDDEVVKEETVEFDEQIERMHTVELTPTQAGVFSYSAEIEPFADEMSQDNNKRAKPGVRVVDKKIRVLLVDDSPRWDVRFLKSVLEADQQRIEPTFILRQADERVVQSDRRFRREFPATLQELRAFDVIILGNLVSDFFLKDELKNLEDYVRKEGGGLLLLAGPNSMPDSYVGTPVEDLLPVFFDAQPPFTVDDELTQTSKNGFRPELTQDGRRSPALRFAVESSENDLLWSQAEPLFWHYPAKRLKPGATALLVLPGQGASREDGVPLIAQQRYGKGQVMYVGIDETWRWRFHPGAQFHKRMWGQVINSLSLAHLLGKTNRVQLEADRSEYAIGDRARLVARLLDKDYNRLTAESVTVLVSRNELKAEEVVLVAQKDQPGVYQGDYVPAAEGDYRLTILDEEDEAELLFKAVNPRIEFDDPGMRQELLGQLAAVSGGEYVPLHELAELAKRLKQPKVTSQPRREERALWNAPGIILLFTMLLGVEWFLRKRSDLL